MRFRSVRIEVPAERASGRIYDPETGADIRGVEEVSISLNNERCQVTLQMVGAEFGILGSPELAGELPHLVADLRAVVKEHRDGTLGCEGVCTALERYADRVEEMLARYTGLRRVE